MTIQSKSRKAVTVLSLALAACASPVLYPSIPSAKNIQAQMAQVNQIAGNDLKQLVRLCNPQPSERAKPSVEMDEQIRKMIARPAPPPMRVFDDLYYVGGDWASAWILKTTDGLVLIDALNNEDEAKRLIEGGMAKLGLDPKNIRYLILTHGHGDHYGGAEYLIRKYGMRVVASEIDWYMMHDHLEFDSKVWGPPPQKDISVKDGDRINLGKSSVVMHLTPGHSEGTLSPVFSVHDGIKAHRVMLWGGTSFNFGKDLHRLESYSDSTEKMRTIAQKERVDVLISNHASFDNSIVKMKMLSANPSIENPFVMGTDAVDRALKVMGLCARTQHERFRL